MNSTLFNIIVILSFITWGIGLYYRNKFMLHMMQLEGYSNENFQKWMKEFRYKVYSKKLVILFVLVILVFTVYSLLPIFNESIINIQAFVLFTIIWAAAILFSIESKNKDAKKGLVFTKRAKRLFIACFVIELVEILIIFVIYVKFIGYYSFNYQVVLFTQFLIYYIAPTNILLANILVKPIEKRINKYYYDMAYNKVRTFKELKTVGITGSYGKTTTKFVTSGILKERFNVLKTPESYNTPMGISKVINNTLNEQHEAFVVEMGARQNGEIEEVAKLANPQIGIITSIGPTHLETFKSIENIMKTKYELIEQLPSDGIAIFNYDNKYVKKLADKTFKEKLLYGFEDVESLDVYATDIEVTETGSNFLLNYKDGSNIKCESNLLGKHNISNLLAGATVAKALGLSIKQIAKGIKSVKPVPHRLQLINPGTGVIVIDDAFNSNPDGAKAALEVLSKFKEGNKIIVTPGMVELGEHEEKENQEFGNNIASVCDFVILVGERRTKPIFKGLMDSRYNKNKIFIVNTLNEATQKIQQIVKPKDVVLFENDLPDNYNE